MVDAILNRASLEPLYPSAIDATSDIVAMLRGLACLDQPVLRCHDNPWNIPVVTAEDGMTSLGEVVDRLYGGSNHDVAAFFDALQRMAPADHDLGEEFLEQILQMNDDARTPAPELEETFDSVQSAGFDAIQCAATNAVLLSLGRTDLWRFDRMGFVTSSLLVVSFDHIATLEHGDCVAMRREVELTAANFWELKNTRFQNLMFGLDVKDQIRSFPREWLNLAFVRLRALNALSEKYASGQVILDGMEKRSNGIKPESDSTMQQFGNNRRFRGADGRMNTFEEHVWVGRANRIHIIIRENIIEIGYLGHHLPTVNDPH